MINFSTYKIVLADVDIISKLAHWRLLELLPYVFSCELNQIATLPSIKHRAIRVVKGGIDRLFKDAETAAYAWDHLQHMIDISEPNGEIVSELQRIPKIDAGEAILLAVAHSNDHSLLATGDKNAIRSFYKLLQTKDYKKLSGRIVCLEQIMFCCLQKLGLTVIRNKLKPAMDVDLTIKNIFGSQCDVKDDSVLEGFNSYISALNSETGSVLIYQSSS